MEEVSDLWTAYHMIMEDSKEGGGAPTEARRPVYRGNGFKIVEIPDDSDSEGYEDDPLLQQYNKHDAESLKAIRSIHEIPTDQVNPGEVPAAIPDNWMIIPACKVISKVGSLCVCDTVGVALAPGSLLVTQDRIPITRVIELFGNVDSPKMVVHCDKDVGFVFYTPMEDSHIITKEERERIEQLFRGTDASNRYDEPAEPKDSSGDEMDDKDDQIDDMKIGYQR